MSKKEGGMGFRDLKLFNLAMRGYYRIIALCCTVVLKPNIFRGVIFLKLRIAKIVLTFGKVC